MAENGKYHVPVLLREAVDALAPKSGGIYIDCTLGGGGHSEEILKRADCRLIGIDRDGDAIAEAGARLAKYSGFEAVRANYDEIGEILAKRGIDKVDGILFDLGVSSHQIDEKERGFSYMADAPLDMRMDRDEKLTAYDVINGYTGYELTDIIRRYGEEKYAAGISSAIIKRRSTAPIETTFGLVEAIESALPPKELHMPGHPAKRTFQAIRMEVNKELEHLRKALNAGFDSLTVGGTEAVITFHSLEERVVSDAFRSFTEGCICPKSFPVCVCGRTPRATKYTKRPLLPTGGETDENPRAKSAKLRAVVKLGERYDR